MDKSPPLLDLIERLGSLLRADQRRAGAGLQPVHLQLLDYLARCNRFSDTPAAITAFLGATKGTVSQSLALLEREELVQRSEDARDQRVTHFALTRAGRRALRAARLPPGWEQALTGLDAREQEAATRALARLLQGLQRANGQRTFGQCRSCRHLQPDGRHWRCGLNGERLSAADTRQICHEHEYPPANRSGA